MNMETAIRVGGIIFEGFELLDFYGPLEMFGLMEGGASISVLAQKIGPVKSSAGPCGYADATMADSQGFDVLLIPGGIGTRREMVNPGFLTELTRLAEASKLVATVCTGSLLLSKTGLLDGLRATTNKKAFQLVKNHSPKVQWIAKARWVEDEKYITSSGVSAGMDMTLAVIEKLCGRERAMQVAKSAEYEWHQDSTHDPFAVTEQLV